MKKLAFALVGLVACAHSAPHPTHATPSFDVSVAGKGRPVVLISDLGVSSRVWDSTVAHLAATVQTHALTLAGFAGQPAAEGAIVPRVERELVRYLRDRELHDVVVVGHMFGASIAYSLAAHEPDLISGIVVIDVLPCQSALAEPDEPRESVLAQARQIHDALASHPPSVEGQARRLGTMMSDAAQARRIAEESVRSSPRAVADAYLELMQLDLRREVRTLRARALVLISDLSYSPEEWPKIEASWHRQIDPIPQHELVVVRASHHYIMFDQPTAWFAALDTFLRKVGA